MPLSFALRRVVSGSIWILAAVFAARADAEIVDRDFSGRFSAESRWFPATGAFPGQRSLASGFVAEPKLYLEDAAGRSFTLTPFFRYDHSDPRRTHFDLREAYLLLLGDIGDDQWELRLGVDRVFWGVTESQHLVDIVNQIDFVEHPGGESKLGQPMVHLTWSGNWGVAEVFGLPYHRARTFSGLQGRLRLPLVIDNERVTYESAAGEWHFDFASRYSHSFGLLDLGVSLFDGTSREPFLFPGSDAGGMPAFTQYYAQIRQFGLDAQMTVGSWLFKLEAIQRSGARNLLGLEEDYAATVFGGEYTFYSVFGSAADVTLLGEWNYDGRGRNATPNRSPNTLENDLFSGTRLAFNDVQSTEITVSFLTDLGRATRALALEFDRRITGQWSMHFEAVSLLSVDRADLHYAMRDDSFVELNLVYNF
ncbi:MAG: hypothetical protein OXL36_05610 [Bryobacterales bacterium]|nr:hypothetical protein [Bryobacterales bacterium]MDE0295513.1 hypothetical protein [Bryobacterales bacterium]